MVERLCQFYGESIVLDDDKQEYFDFPQLSALCNDGVEQRLRTAAFGYRAGYIAKAAQQLTERGGEQWLCSLVGTEYTDARRELMTIAGIGPKVRVHFSIDSHIVCVLGRRLYLSNVTANVSCRSRRHSRTSTYGRTLHASVTQH